MRLEQVPLVMRSEEGFVIVGFRRGTISIEEEGLGDVMWLVKTWAVLEHSSNWSLVYRFFGIDWCSKA
jgi:hypothetical protein